MLSKDEVVIGIGSNLGLREKFLEKSIVLLEELKILSNITKSSIYESPALLKENSPKEWNLPFLNMAVKGKTNLRPLDLLKSLKEIENSLGRKNTMIWSPREIDLDILAYKNQIINLPNLCLPHKELISRSFCILPFAEIAPNWIYPLNGHHKGKSASEIAAEIIDPQIKLYLE